MKQHIRSTRLGLSILLILSCFAVNGDTAETTTSEVEYHYYDLATDREGQKYHQFLPVPPPQELYYYTRMKITRNIDDTPEKETLILMTAETGDEWSQVFLIIAAAETEAALPKKIDVFKLFDAGTHVLDVPAKTVVPHNPLFVFTEPLKDAQMSNDVSLKLIDLTGDGILDVWVEFGYSVAVISFQNGEFEEVFSSHWGRIHSPKYVDLDNDSTYEIKIPNTIYINGIPGAACPEWVSLYAWNGTTYVLNNERFYANNDEFLIRLLRQYNYQLLQYGRFIPLCEAYSFYVGLAHYYRGSVASARWHLHWLFEKVKNNDYIRAADFLLKHLPSD